MLQQGKKKQRMLGGQFGAFRGWSACSGEDKKVPFLGVVNLERYRLVSLTVFSSMVIF